MTPYFKLGSTPLTRDQATWGTGLPETEQSKTAVLPWFTVRSEGETVTFGAETDSPSSPFIPGTPGALISPLTPFHPSFLAAP